MMTNSDVLSKSRTFTTVLLEMGIMLHSILIGLALGLAPEDELPVLLIAISFHQFFEGFAISSAALSCGMKTLKVSPRIEHINTNHGSSSLLAKRFVPGDAAVPFKL